jgi:hypothetical protein
MKHRWSVSMGVGCAAAVALALVVSCSSTPQPAGLAEGCSINSDCDSPLICAFTRCHEQCASSRDCPMGETCVTDSNGKDDVCRLPVETTCNASSPCATGLVCGADETCGTGCQTTTDCSIAGQACSSGTCHDVATDGGVDSASDSPADAPPDILADSPPDSPQDGAPVDTGSDACVALTDAGTFPYVPSNFDPDHLAIADGGVPDAGEVSGGGIDWANAPDVNIGASCDYTCLPPPITVTMSDGTQAWLFAMHSLTIQSSVTLDLRASNHYTVEIPPVIFAVLTTVDIQGTVDAASSLYTPGPGAYGSPSGQTPQGQGGGGNGLDSNYPDSAPSGGSFCGVGGRGGFTAPPQAQPGQAYGNATIIPLVAGSGGGDGQGSYFGAGGGALQISAGQSILVRNVGAITAGGGGGQYGGGGSGGAILLEAPSVTMNGILAANGGGGGAFGNGGAGGAGSDATPNNLAAPGSTEGLIVGGAGSAGATIIGMAGNQAVPDSGANGTGSGGGGAGWIRINTPCGMATIGANATLSPDLTTVCASQGTIGQ